MIVSSRLKGLERFYRTRNARGIQTAHDVKLIRILAALDAAIGPAELILPSYRLHSLNGELENFWSVWVNGNWRVTFRFMGVNVELVDYQDYH